MQDIVPIRELAKNLGVHKSNLLKWLRSNEHSLGIDLKVRARTKGSGPNRTIVFTRDQVEKILALREQQGMGGAAVTIEEKGFFYIIQLIPEFDPNRVKLGFAGNVTQRLAQHRTSAPTAKCRQTWRCKRSWEQTAIDYLALGHCRLISNEVFECDDVDSLVERADQLFRIMPSPDCELQISKFGRSTDSAEQPDAPTDDTGR